MKSPQNTVPKILAIDPGTREIGVAVLAGDQLELYGVKTITDRKSPSAILLQGREIVYRLISQHRPTLLALERPFIGYGNRSAVLVSLTREITRLAKDLGLDVRQMSPATIKKTITGNGAAKKKDVARKLCERFPELQVHLEQARGHKERYWANMFDAVALSVAVTNHD